MKRRACRDCHRELSVGDHNRKYKRCPKCVNVEADRRVIRDAEIMRLYRMELTTRQIGAKTGVTHATVRNVVKAQAFDPFEGNDFEAETNETAERCPRCFLALPHASCLPSIYVYASQRRGEAAE